jgi:hypothetical protein
MIHSYASALHRLCADAAHAGSLHVMAATDPAPLLSTITGTSAGLVAIIGGLIIARLVGLDSDEKTNSRGRAAVQVRLDQARQRYAAAAESLDDWDASELLDSREILTAIGEGKTDPQLLRRMSRNDCPLDGDQLLPRIAARAAEFSAAREFFVQHPPTSGDVAQGFDGWDYYRQRITDLPIMRWQQIWKSSYREAARRVAEEIRAYEEAHPRPRNPLDFISDINAGFAARNVALKPQDNTGYRSIRTRRHDALVADKAAALQRVQDYETELERLQQDHRAIARPDLWLYLGFLVLAALALVGVALPVMKMSEGTSTLTQVRWLAHWFIAALAVLVTYIGAYLWNLTLRRAASRTTDDTTRSSHWRWPARKRVDPSDRDGLVADGSSGGVARPQ